VPQPAGSRLDYPPAMGATAPDKPRGLALMFGWRRLRFTVLFSLAIGFLMGLGWESGLLSILVRTVTLGLIAMVVFGFFEQWPRTLPRWLARWALQVIAVALVMPLATFFVYVASTEHGAPPFWEVPKRLEGFGALTFMGVLLAPWAALGALVRQKDRRWHSTWSAASTSARRSTPG
jgi:hypothetical protein